MDINMTTQEIADTIANAVTETANIRCEVFTNEYGKAVIISDYTDLVARITPSYNCIRVVAAPLNREAVVTNIPDKATSISDVREVATQLDDAIAHVTAAAEAAYRQ